MKKINLDLYSTFIFDCDGVLLNSNKIKSNAFYLSTLKYGLEIANEFMDYHKMNGGISRYEKYNYLTNHLMPKYNLSINKDEKKYLIDLYSEIVLNQLYKCQIVSGLDTLRKQNPNSNWLVVSGGDQIELRKVFKYLKIANFFNGGIFGSPSTKTEILEKLKKESKIKKPAVFFGDSKLDHLTAKLFDIKFIFLSNWTEFKNWRNYVKENELETHNSLTDLVK